MRKSILVIDQEDAVFKSVSSIFQAQDITFLNATNADDGIELLKSRNPSILMIDYSLCINRLLDKINEIAPHVYLIIIVRNYIQYLDAASEYKNIQNYLLKPVDGEMIADIVGKALSGEDGVSGITVPQAIEPLSLNDDEIAYNKSLPELEIEKSPENIMGSSIDSVPSESGVNVEHSIDFSYDTNSDPLYNLSNNDIAVSAPVEVNDDTNAAYGGSTGNTTKSSENNEAFKETDFSETERIASPEPDIAKSVQAPAVINNDIDIAGIDLHPAVEDKIDGDDFSNQNDSADLIHSGVPEVSESSAEQDNKQTSDILSNESSFGSLSSPDAELSVNVESALPEKDMDEEFLPVNAEPALPENDMGEEFRPVNAEPALEFHDDANHEVEPLLEDDTSAVTASSSELFSPENSLLVSVDDEKALPLDSLQDPAAANDSGHFKDSEQMQPVMQNQQELTSERQSDSVTPDIKDIPNSVSEQAVHPAGENDTVSYPPFGSIEVSGEEHIPESFIKGENLVESDSSSKVELEPSLDYPMFANIDVSGSEDITDLEKNKYLVDDREPEIPPSLDYPIFQNNNDNSGGENVPPDLLPKDEEDSEQFSGAYSSGSYDAQEKSPEIDESLNEYIKNDNTFETEDELLNNLYSLLAESDSSSSGSSSYETAVPDVLEPLTEKPFAPKASEGEGLAVTPGKYLAGAKKLSQQKEAEAATPEIKVSTADLHEDVDEYDSFKGLAAPEKGSSSDLNDYFSDDSVNVRNAAVTDSHEIPYHDSQEGEEEQGTLFNLFSDMDLDYNSVKSDAILSAQKTSDMENTSAVKSSQFEQPVDEENGKSGFRRIAEMISPKESPKSSASRGGWLSIDLSKDEIGELLEKSISKSELKNIIKDVVRENIGSTVEKLVPSITEQLVREEINLIKGGK